MNHLHYNQQEIDFLKSISHLPRKKMAILFNEKFNQNRDYNAMRRFCMRFGIKGHKRESLTHGFQKGHKRNDKPIGYESITSRGEVMIKTEQGRIPKARHVWSMHNGDIPKDSQVCFKDQNKLNCDISNLILMKKAEAIIYNRNYRKYALPENNETCFLLSKLKHARLKAS